MARSLPDRSVDGRERLVSVLRDAEVGSAAIERASEAGRLPSFAVEVALGDGAEYTLTGIARAAGLTPAYVREMMQALGRPDPGRGERVFTREDAQLARIVGEMLEAGLPQRGLTEAARVIGLAMSQSAEAVRQLVAGAFLKPGDSEATLGVRYVEVVAQLAPVMPDLFALTFRAHLRDGINGELLSEAERHSGRLADTQGVAIAFADLVGYTSLGDRVSAGELGTLAGRFAAIATAVSRSPVRLVKTIGDGALFVSSDANALLAALIDLRTRLGENGREFPAVRIGASFGPATVRSGDWFGAAVNVASRVVSVAKPGQLLVTDGFAAKADAGQWKKRRRRNFKGVDDRARLYSYEAKQ